MSELDKEKRALQQSIKNLEESLKNLRRTHALIEMTGWSSPYRPLVQLMCRLGLVNDWPI